MGTERLRAVEHSRVRLLARPPLLRGVGLVSQPPNPGYAFLTKPLFLFMAWKKTFASRRLRCDLQHGLEVGFSELAFLLFSKTSARKELCHLQSTGEGAVQTLLNAVVSIQQMIVRDGPS